MADRVRGTTLGLVAISLAALIVSVGVMAKARSERKAMASLKRDLSQLTEANRSLEKNLEVSQAQSQQSQLATEELTQALAHEQQRNEHLSEAIRQWEASKRAAEALAAKTQSKKTVSSRQSP